jgi:hypothetical protein
MLTGFALCVAGIVLRDDPTSVWLGLAVMVLSVFTERVRGDMAL